MKITLSYMPEEEWLVAFLEALVRQLYPDTKVRESERHPPRKHAYLAIKNAKNPREDGTNV